MSLNTDKIIFKSKEEIRKYAESLVEEVLKIPEDHFGDKTSTYQDSIYYAVKAKGKEKFVDEEVARLLRQQELDPRVDDTSLYGISNGDSDEGPRRSFSTSGEDCKLFTVNFFYHAAYTTEAQINPDGVIASLNSTSGGFADSSANTSLYGDRKQLDTKFRFKKGNVYEIPTVGNGNPLYSKVYACGEGNEIWTLHSNILTGDDGLPNGVPDKSFNIYYAKYTSTCSFGAFAYYPFVRPYTGSSIFPTYSFASSANYIKNTYIHELGHNFNLIHVFGGPAPGNCGDDGVSDTPLQKATSSMARQNVCGDGPSMNENWMDYAQGGGFDPSLFFFTEGQQARMNAAVDLDMSDWWEWCDCETLATVDPPEPPSPPPPPPGGGSHGGGVGPIEFPAATLIGYSSTGNYFGEDISRWRTVQTVTIEGIMNPDNINAMIGDGSDIPGSANTYLGHNVSINGYVVNRSRLISLDFVASDGSITEKHDHIAKFRATYEVYIPNTDNNVFGITFNNLQALEEFSEEMTFSLDENGIFNCQWTMSVKYADSSTGGGVTGVSAREAAQLLWTNITTNTPLSIPPTLNTEMTNTGHIWSLSGKWYDTETYDDSNGSASFSRTRKVFSNTIQDDADADGTNDTIKGSSTRKHSLEISEDGIINITEDGEVESLLEDTSHVNGWGGGAKTAKEIVGNRIFTGGTTAYSLCNDLYNNYKEEIGSLSRVGGTQQTTHTGTLYNQYTNFSVSYDPDGGKINYSITYTDDPKFLAGVAWGSFESKISKDKETSSDGQVYSVYTEEGQWEGHWGGIVEQHSSLQGYLKDNAIAQMSGSLSRIQAMFSPSSPLPATILSRKLSYNSQENKFNFVIKYTTEGSVYFPQNTTNLTNAANIYGPKILKMDQKVEDKQGLSKKEWYNPPNNPLNSEFVHVGNDIPEISSRKVTISGKINRWASSGIYAISDEDEKFAGAGAAWAKRFRSLMLNQLLPTMRVECLKVFSEYTWIIPQKFWSQKYYYSDFSWNLKNTGEFSVSLEMKYLVPIGPKDPFPERYSDNTRIT